MVTLAQNLQDRGIRLEDPFKQHQEELSAAQPDLKPAQQDLEPIDEI